MIHVNTITDTLKRLNKNLHGDDSSWYRVPEHQDLAAQYLLLYEMSLPYGLDLNDQINIDKSATRFIVTTESLSTRETLEMVEEVVGTTTEATSNLEERGKLGQRAVDAGASVDRNIRDGAFAWTPEAAERVNRVPEGFMRNSTKKRIEKLAEARGTDLIDLEIVEEGIKEGLKLMEEMIKKQNGKKNGKEDGFS